MQTASSGADRTTYDPTAHARSGAAPFPPAAAAVITGALWVLLCAELAAAGWLATSALLSVAFLVALTALVVYRVPAGAARRQLRPTDWSPYDRRRSGARHRRFRALGRLVTAGRAHARWWRRQLHRHGAGTDRPVSMPPGTRAPGQPAKEPSLGTDRDGKKSRGSSSN